MKRLTAIILTAFILVLGINCFADSQPSSWAATEVNVAIKENIVPESIRSDYRNAITRKEFCEMVVLVYDKLGGAQVDAPVNPFTDIDNASVTKAYSLGIVLGVGEGLFAPDNPITRQEICTMLTRAVKAAKPSLVIPDTLPNTFPDQDSISDWAMHGVQYINIIEVMLGDEANRINPLNNTTREQAILLSHRLTKSFGQELSTFLTALGFRVSGNNSMNMLNGAFAVTYTGGPLFLSDSTGIYSISDDGTRSYVTQDEALTMYMQGSEKYYLRKSDGLICNGSGKPLCNMKARNFIPAGNHIYFTSDEASGIYRIPLSGGEAMLYINAEADIPVSSGKYIYYSTPDGIYKYDTNADTSEQIYSGQVSNFTVSNSNIYFKDSEGYVVSADNTGSDIKRMTRTPVDLYCTYGTNAIAYTYGDAVYKTDAKGTFVIRIYNGTFTQINSYNNYIFLKDSFGNIYRLSSNGLEFTKLN